MRQAAIDLGVTPGTLSELERGLRQPHDVTLARIAKGYDVPVEELLGEFPTEAVTPAPLRVPPSGSPSPETTEARRDADFQAGLLAWLQGLPIDEQRALLRSVWDDWTLDVDADRKGIEAAIEIEREIGARSVDILRTLIVIMDPSEVKSLTVESKKQREAELSYLQMLFEGTVAGDLSTQEAARKVQRFLEAA